MQHFAPAHIAQLLFQSYKAQLKADACFRLIAWLKAFQSYKAQLKDANNNGIDDNDE